MAGSIRIAAWNANGLEQRNLELALFLDSQKIDICLIAETHFTKETVMRLRGYKVYHTPSNKCRGGSAVIVKENIKHHEELKFSSEIIQATTIRIHIKKLQCNITAIYSPPRHNIMVEDYIEFLQSLGNRFVAGGDYNSKHTCWGSRLTTTKGRRLLKAVQTLSCNVLTEGTPTYRPTDPNKCPMTKCRTLLICLYSKGCQPVLQR